jgi:hypothetical protein
MSGQDLQYSHRCVTAVPNRQSSCGLALAECVTDLGDWRSEANAGFVSLGGSRAAPFPRTPSDIGICSFRRAQSGQNCTSRPNSTLMSWRENEVRRARRSGAAFAFRVSIYDDHFSDRAQVLRTVRREDLLSHLPVYGPMVSTKNRPYSKHPRVKLQTFVLRNSGSPRIPVGSSTLPPERREFVRILPSTTTLGVLRLPCDCLSLDRVNGSGVS